jgi:hypothetical protein
MSHFRGLFKWSTLNIFLKTSFFCFLSNFSLLRVWPDLLENNVFIDLPSGLAFKEFLLLHFREDSLNRRFLEEREWTEVEAENWEYSFLAFWSLCLYSTSFSNCFCLSSSPSLRTNRVK